MIAAGTSRGEQETCTSQAFQERPSASRSDQPGEGEDALPIFSPVLAGWSREHLLEQTGVDMHVYELVTSTQGAGRLLSASQAH